jgi:hypothetical protein
MYMMRQNKRLAPMIGATLMVAGIMGSAEAKSIKGEICPTKVTGLIQKCSSDKKCVLHLKEGDVLSKIVYIGSDKCRKKTGVNVEVSRIDKKGVAFKVKGMVLAGMKKDGFMVNYGRKQSTCARALGLSAGKTKNPKVARLMMRR